MMTKEIIEKAREEVLYYLGLAKNIYYGLDAAIYQTKAKAVWWFVIEYAENADALKKEWRNYDKQFEDAIDSKTEWGEGDAVWRD